MAKALTTKALESIKPGEKDREIPDGCVSGLYLAVRPSGAKSWCVRYRFEGKPRKLTLGAFPGIGLRAARDLAGRALDAVTDHRDPAAEKQEAKRAAAAEQLRASDLIDDVVASYVEKYAKRQTRQTSWREKERLLKKEVIGAWKGRRLSTIGRADVHDLLDKIVDRGAAVMANRTLATFKHMCAWAVERGLIEASPCDKVKAPSSETSRKRTLSDEEIRIAWTAFERVGWCWGKMAQLLLLTGARRSEIAEARWSEIDLEAKTLTLPPERSKNGQEHVIPLSDTANAILKDLPRIGDGKKSDFVFTKSGSAPITGFSASKMMIDAEIAKELGDAPPFEPWVLHDLSRTVATNLQRLGVRLEVTEAVLGHVSGSRGGVVGIYQRYDFADEKRLALDAWARKIDSIVNGAAATNVVELAAVRP